MPGKLIVFEGFDATGKTTLSKWVAEEFHYEYHKSPEGNFAAARGHFDYENVDLLDRFAFYTSVAIRNSVVIRERLADNISIVLDRHYYSAIAYHYFVYQRAKQEVSSVFQSLVQPDLLIYLNVGFPEIQRRLKITRGTSSAEDQFTSRTTFDTVTEVYQKILPADVRLVQNDSEISTVKGIIREHLATALT